VAILTVSSVVQCCFDVLLHVYNIIPRAQAIINLLMTMLLLKTPFSKLHVSYHYFPNFDVWKNQGDVSCSQARDLEHNSGRTVV
jgi:hypothetical protein